MEDKNNLNKNILRLSRQALIIFMILTCSILVIGIVQADQAVVPRDQTGFDIAGSSYMEESDISTSGTTFLSVWRSPTGSVVGQFFSMDGTKIGTNPQVFPTGTRPSVESDGSQYLVVDTVSSSVYGRFIDNDGNMGVSFLVGSGSNTAGAPEVVYDSDDGKFLVVWEQWDGSIRQQIWGCFVSSSGIVGTKFIIGDVNRHNWHPIVTYGNHQFFVAWTSEEASNSLNRDIHGIRLATDGTPIDSSDILICTAPLGQDLGAWGTSGITFDGTNYIVIYRDFAHSTEEQLHGARISTGGLLLDGPSETGGKLIPGFDNGVWESQIVFDGTSRLLIGDRPLKSAHLDSELNVIDSALIVTPSKYGTYPRLVSGGGKFFVTWVSGSGGPYTLKGQILVYDEHPVAVTGPDKIVNLGQIVSLDGSASNDPDHNEPLTYSWSFVSRPAGSVASITNPLTATPSFTPDKVGDYVVQLIVKDTYLLASAPQTITVTVTGPSTPVHNTLRGTNFVTIQAAIDDSATVANDVITVDSGTYAPFTVNKQVTIRGISDGSGLPGIKGTSTLPAITTTVPYVNLQDLIVITNPPNGNTGVFIQATADHNTLTNIAVQDCGVGIWIEGPFSTIDGSTITQGKHGILLYSNNNVVKNSVFDGMSYSGITLGDGLSDTVNFIQDNTFRNMPAVGTVPAIALYSPYNYIMRNHFDNNYLAIITYPGADENYITDNHFWNSPVNGEGETNHWSESGRIPGTNIIGGPYIGGNYWGNTGGTGWSQTCTNNGDGMCTVGYMVVTSPLQGDGYTLTDTVANLPTFDSAATDSTGNHIIIYFSDPMADPTSSPAFFKYKIDSGADNPIMSAALVPGDSHRIDLTVSGPAIAYGDGVTVSYTKGPVTSSDGVYLASFTPQFVQNFVPAAPTTSLHLRALVVNTNGGTALATDWTLAAAGTTPLSGPTPVDSGAGFSAGTYTLSESGPAGYQATPWECVGGTQNGDQITVAAGQDVTCTIRNWNLIPSLTLIKNIVNTGGGTHAATEWTLSAAGPTPLSGTTPVNSGSSFSAGSYTLSESSTPDGYTASAWSCVGGTQNVNQIAVGLGESSTCTITNTYIPPQFSDDFTSGFGNWNLYGSPSPVILPSILGRTGVFDNNGDSWCDSGITTKNLLYTQPGEIIESDVYLQVPDWTGCFASSEVSITQDKDPYWSHPNCPGEGYYDGATISLVGIGDGCSSTPPAYRNHAYVQCSILAEDGTSDGNGYGFQADSFVNGWHTLKMVIDNDRYVSCYIDDTFVYKSLKKIDPDILQGKRLQLGRRSLGTSLGKAYHDNIRLKLGTVSTAPPPTVFSVNPPTGPIAGGTMVTITGSDFTGTPQITFGGIVVLPSAFTPTTIDMVTPAHAAGLVDVTVTTDGGTVTKTGAFTYETTTITLTAAGDQSYYLGENIRFDIDVTPSNSAEPYMFIIGPNIPATGARLNSDPASSPVTNGNPGTFTRAPIQSDTPALLKAQYIWTTAENTPLDAGDYTVYASTQPNDKDHIGGSYYATVSIQIKKPFISATVHPGNGPVGTVFTITGTRAGSQDPVYITCTNNTPPSLTGNLPSDGVKPNDFSVTSTTGDGSTFGQATVQTDGTFSYPWDTSSISGGALLPGSTYGCLVMNTPVNINDAIDNIYADNHYTKLAVQLDGPPLPGTRIEMGATVFIGEQGLNVTHALNAAQDPSTMPNLDMVPPITVIGYWGPLSDIDINSPDATIDLAASYNNFLLSPALFVGRTGNWYIVNTATGHAIHPHGAALVVTDPALAMSIRDDSGTDVSGKSVAQGTRLAFRVDTNMYPAVNPSLRSPLNPATDGYIDIVVKDETGTTLTALYNNNIGMPNAGPNSLETNYVNTQFWYWGSNTHFWDSGALDGASLPLYPVGTYTAYAQSNLHHMKDNYKDPGGADYTGKTVSSTMTVTIVPYVAPTPPVFTQPEAVPYVVETVFSGTVPPETALQVGSAYVDPDTDVPLLDGTTITNTLGVSAWVVAIDRAKNDNLFHPVCYVFVNNDGVSSAEICAMSPPADASAFSYSNQGQIPNPLGKISIQPPFAVDPPCASDATHNYALLISGGIDKDHNYIRYYNDIAFMYKTLVKDYKYDKSHIKVLMSDGSANAAPDLIASYTTANPPVAVYGNSNVDLDGDGIAESWNAATRTNVIAALDSWDTGGATPLDAGDTLFIFTTSHGAATKLNTDPKTNDVDLYLWGTTTEGKISDTDFVNALPTKPKISMMMEQCNGGGFFDEFIPTTGTTPTRALATAAKGNQVSHSNDFSYFWITGVAGHDTLGNTANADLVAPIGQVSQKEAFDYGSSHDPSAISGVETPTWGDWTSGTGGSQFFSTCSATQPTITVKLPTTTPAANTWKMGSTYIVTWNTANLPSPTPYVKIQLMKGAEPGVVQADLSTTSKLASTGSTGVSWKVPPTLNGGPGTDYWIKISTITITPQIVGRSSSSTMLNFPDVGKSATTSLTIKSLPMPGTASSLIDIKDSSGAPLSLNNPQKTTGSTGSYTFTPVSGGTYSIKLAKSCYYNMITPASQTVIAGIPSTKTITLDPLPAGCDNSLTGSIAINSLPDIGFHVYIKGKTDTGYIDKGENTPKIKEIGAGDYTVKVEMPGYNTQEQDVKVTAGHMAEATFTLEPKLTAPHRAVFRGASKGNNWLFDYDMNGITPDYQDKFGQLGDIPLVGDFDKNGQMDRVVFRGVSKGNNWFFDPNMDGKSKREDKFGQLGDIPLVGDFDNDGIMDRAVFRGVSKGNNWFFDYGMDSTGGKIDYQDKFGQLGDIPVVGDFNNDGIMDRAVFRGVSKGNNWFFDYDMNGITPDYQDKFGQLGDIPVVGDFNNDKIMDRAVFRSVTRGNNWLVDWSMNGGTPDYQDKFGQLGDIPLMWNS